MRYPMKGGSTYETKKMVAVMLTLDVFCLFTVFTFIGAVIIGIF
jgi:hypothetical protein